jgi:hypothetical protein
LNILKQVQKCLFLLAPISIVVILGLQKYRDVKTTCQNKVHFNTVGVGRDEAGLHVVNPLKLGLHQVRVGAVALLDDVLLKPIPLADLGPIQRIS